MFYGSNELYSGLRLRCYVIVRGRVRRANIYVYIVFCIVYPVRQYNNTPNKLYTFPVS